ncbi:MECDP-synthase [Marinobacter sp. V034]|uniref:MECDP-synthase n=1 Tax=Marinobacter sp. V034 TaxID=3459610 RepID=UPI004044B5AB
MFKKTLLALAVASSVGLTGCLDDGSSGKNANPDYKIDDTTIDRSIVRPLYNPNPLAADEGDNAAAFPINSDLILLLGATQSANYDFTGLSTGSTPADDAVNRLSGFSTSGAFNIPFDGELNPATVAANQTVFLLPLNVKDAIDGLPGALPNTNPSSIDATAPFLPPTSDAQASFRAEVISQDGGKNNAIRVVPLEPLAEYQKYLVVVTNSVKGANGKPIERSTADVNLANGVLGNAALANVKTILATSDKLANGFLQQSSIPGASALAYTFTTNRDADVLRAMTGPGPSTYLGDLGQKIGFTAQLKAVRDNYPTLNFSQLTAKLQDLGAKAAQIQADPSFASQLTAQELAAITALGQAQAQTQPAAIQAAIASQVGKTIHIPQPRPAFFYPSTSAASLATIAGIGAADNTNPIFMASQQVRVSQGAIALPYFQQLPGDGGQGIVTGSWKGSTSLETALNDELAGAGNTVFQFLRDIDGQLNVNGYFPFPQQNATVAVPVVVYHPAPGTIGVERPASCNSTTQPNGITIFQHGITVDRSVSMLPGILLANQACQAVVAIDQPLHGLAGAAPGTVAGLTELDETTLKATIASLSQPVQDALAPIVNADYIGERHFNYTANASLQPVAADTANVSSGSLFINPLNMMNSNDNLRQGVVDLLNLSISAQIFTLDGTPNTLAGLPTHFVGHSLGGISGTTFSALADNAVLNGTLNGLLDQAMSPVDFPSLNTVALHNTGGQVTRLIENSPAFSGQILGGLAQAGVNQGTANFESFFYVFQSVVDSTDPVSFAKDFGDSTTSVAPTNILLSEVVGDTTVPNEANVNPLGNALSAPLTGTEPLMALIDLGAEDPDGKLSDGNGVSLVEMGSIAGEGALPAASFFVGTNPCTDANHGTFVAPLTPANPDDARCPAGSNTTRAFAEMVRQTVLAINGAPVLTTLPSGAADTAVLGESNTVESALDQDK